MKNRLACAIAMVSVVAFASLARGAPGTTWNRKLERSRFQVLKSFGDAAVFDKETGLVWERSPSTTTTSWVFALGQCYQSAVGGRKGWRLPTIEELASLLDPDNPTGDPDLPPGHPFSSVQSASFWSATSYA